ncbi:related to ribosomal protein YmL17 precursor, mitochondrial [Phialocephala subalpina]|uniref:Large ribosomal subunit protein mL46 n=1 Tax=Phialocephala subalpina TaxID=576137 RepID=A0A1L7XPF8_9HELO|nr:related to ribosomal protein YmL17 precursor, mitochondrial [Phialocephala subalpina]
MTASSRGSRAAASLIRSSKRPNGLICSECISHLSPSQRTYAVAAEALKTQDAVPNSELQHLRRTPPVSTSPEPSHYKTKAGVLLSRAPILTAPQTSFEKAYFFYQKRLNERLAMPFTRYFYFKKDSPSDTDWKIKAKERNGVAARELGGYNPYSDLGWNDEILVKEKEMVEPRYISEVLVKDSKVRAVEGKDGMAVEVKEGEEGILGVGEGSVDRPLGRITDADRKGDVRRLDRQLARTLYLVVKRKDGGWGFPSGELVGRENLHQAAERILVQTAGLNMNTWIIGHVPIGHHILKPRYTYSPDSTPSLAKQGEKTFFMKGRIMAGQADLKENLFGLEDFKWLTKEEVQKVVADKYFSYVRGMLADR